MLVKRYRCALRNPAWSISPTVQIRDVSLAMIQPRPRPIFHRLKSTCTCLYRAAAGLVVLLHKRGVPTGYLEAQSLKRTRGFRTRTGGRRGGGATYFLISLPSSSQIV